MKKARSTLSSLPLVTYSHDEIVIKFQVIFTLAVATALSHRWFTVIRNEGTVPKKF